MNLRPRSISAKLLLSHFLAVVLVSGSIGTYFYLSATDSLMAALQSRLLNSAALISQVLDAEPLEAIRGPADMESPVYAEHLALLREFQRANPDVAFVYVMRREDDGVHFVLDSDESSAQALPGTLYGPKLDTLRAGFDGPSVDTELNEDRWGVFLSGYAPIKNGEGRYLVGIDMRADDVQRKFRQIRSAGILSLVAAVLLALLFSRVLARQLVRPIRLLALQCREITEGHLGDRVQSRTRDEMDSLVAAFNAMAERLEQTERGHREAQRRLTQAKEDLERRVAQRTRNLADLNQRLLNEIAERKRAQAVLAEMAHTDPLTGLMNRRAMLDQLQHQAKYAARTGKSFVVLCADIDNFKSINDTHGHEAGDHLLRLAGERLTAAVRGQDQVSRWGGEEFLLLLPESDLEAGVAAAEKIRRALESEPFHFGGVRLNMTLSIGVSAYPGYGPINACILAADQALYRAKDGGRNRVEAARAAG